MRKLVVLVCLLVLSPVTIAQALDQLVFATDWLAQAEHGGFYQALAEGTYRKHRLDVTIKMGGPQVNGLQLLAAGQLDVAMGDALQALSATEQNYGFTDDQKRPYGFSVQPFLVDPNLSQQGFATSEPFSIEQGGITPVVFLLADLGYPPYSEALIARRDTLDKRADVLRRFVLASAEGWKSYLANPAPGNALIKRDNPQMSDALLAYGHRKLKEYAIVEGGDAKTLGLLTMTGARWGATVDFLRQAGLAKSGVDYGRAYSLGIVNDVKVLP